MAGNELLAIVAAFAIAPIVAPALIVTVLPFLITSFAITSFAAPVVDDAAGENP
ncbi:MAG: hypothetical protein QOK44_3229 [Betaproteobacteria bacterium]|jgi:hypothetical protein|nr:hypothetical protein [Betaproteobacteria bacterium]